MKALALLHLKQICLFNLTALAALVLLLHKDAAHERFNLPGGKPLNPSAGLEGGLLELKVDEFDCNASMAQLQGLIISGKAKSMTPGQFQHNNQTRFESSITLYWTFPKRSDESQNKTVTRLN